MTDTPIEHDEARLRELMGAVYAEPWNTDTWTPSSEQFEGAAEDCAEHVARREFERGAVSAVEAMALDGPTDLAADLIDVEDENSSNLRRVTARTLLVRLGVIDEGSDDDGE